MDWKYSPPSILPKGLWVVEGQTSHSGAREKNKQQGGVEVSRETWVI